MKISQYIGGGKNDYSETKYCSFWFFHGGHQHRIFSTLLKFTEWLLICAKRINISPSNLYSSRTGTRVNKGISFSALVSQHEFHSPLYCQLG